MRYLEENLADLDLLDILFPKKEAREKKEKEGKDDSA